MSQCSLDIRVWPVSCNNKDNEHSTDAWKGLCYLMHTQPGSRVESLEDKFQGHYIVLWGQNT